MVLLHELVDTGEILVFQTGLAHQAVNLRSERSHWNRGSSLSGKSLSQSQILGNQTTVESSLKMISVWILIILFIDSQLYEPRSYEPREHWA
jgi:hypothetical protein